MPDATGLSWYVMQTKPRRELMVASLLGDRPDMTVFLPEVLQPGGRGAPLTPLFPGYLFVQVDLAHSALSTLNHTPGAVGLVGSQGQPTAVANAVVQGLQERVTQVNAQGGLAVHNFRPGDAVTFTAGPLQGLDAVFNGPLEPTQRVQVLLHFLGQAQEMTVDARLLEKVNRPPPAPAEPRPRRTRGKGRRIRSA